MGTLSRKVGKWIYYYKAGNKKMEGTYAVLDLLGIPNVRHGIWNIYHEDGSLFQQIAFECGEVREIHFFDMNGEIV
jgi:antitoxin component YwqK of YwqJK toxin-antitoxin module